MVRTIAHKVNMHQQSLLIDQVFKPGVCGQRPRAPGFLKLLWFTHWYMCVCVCLSVCMSVCVSAPVGINNHWHDMV